MSIIHHHNLRFYTGFCRYSESTQKIHLDVIEIAVLGKSSPEYKAYPLICSNEECPKSGNITCDLYQEFIKH